MIVHFHNQVGEKAQLVDLNQEAAAVSLDLSPNPATVGQDVTAKVAVSGVDGVAPTGTVTLKQGDTTVGTTAVGDDGTATFHVTPDAAGSFAYTANYSGDSAYASGSSDTETLQVTAAEATVGLDLSPNPVTVGKQVTATITVSGAHGDATGTVTLRRLGDNAGTVGSATLTNGSATISFTPSATGTTQYQATYAGDSHYATGESSAQNLVVNPKAKPSVTMSFKPSKVKGGTPTTITVKVTGSAGTATGTVTVRRLDGAGAPSVFKARKLANGSVSFSYTPGRAKGTFHYQVTYSGDANYAAGTSARVALTVI
jgi:hypothetical protein